MRWHWVTALPRVLQTVDRLSHETQPTKTFETSTASASSRALRSSTSRVAFTFKAGAAIEEWEGERACAQEPGWTCRPTAGLVAIILGGCSRRAACLAGSYTLQDRLVQLLC